IMCGHLLVPALDPELPASLSRRVLTGLLRERLGFTGLAVTDAIEMGAVAAMLPQPEIAVRALAAGADAVCVGITSPGGENVAALRAAIVRAVHEGALAEERLAEATGRVDALADWHAAAAGRRAAAAAAPVPLDPAHRVSRLGLAAARRALRVTCPAAPRRPVIAEPPVVVEMSARPHRAIESGAPFGPGTALAARLPGTRRVALRPDRPAPPGAAELAGRPVVVVTHDAHRHAWMARALAEIVRVRPDAVVVETGLPGPAAGAVHLATGGDSRVSALAAAEWLTEP
ncbi:glycoside hydrolase family 3 N-terminal domain-containing protein, partial [Sphaerisporangium rufum]|uniref:glycoside hydrolase family 3 N-terminal domain-containing protein n=1 Tax=Sphaerisporangium rufum TaxID=1381558 RepID=UPI0023B21D8C